MQKLITSLLLIFLFFNANAQDEADNFISAKAASQQYAQKFQGLSLIIFPEVREKPIKWDDSLRLNWLENIYTIKPYVFHAQPGEYFVFQVGAWAIDKDIKNVQVRFADLKNEDGKIITSQKITCFNAGGTNYLGKPFTENINITDGKVQALWMGINLPETAKGIYYGSVNISADGVHEKTLKIKLEISGKVVADHGFDEGKRLSRLAWLNSTVGINNKITKGYVPVSREDKVIKILGRSTEIGDNGLPEKIMSYFTSSNQSIAKQGGDIIDKPFQFIIEKENGEFVHLLPGKLQFTQQSPSFITWKVVNTSGECDVVCNGRLAFDGFASFGLQVKAKKTISIKDIRLEVSMDKDKATYMMGLNKEGGLRPKEWQWKWDTTKNQDALWTGAVNGGLQIKWKAENYVLPLVNIYYDFGRLHLPPSWGNEGKGGVNVYEKGKSVMINAYSGTREMKKGEQLNYDFELLETPFKTMNKEIQFGDHYYHSGKNVSDGFIHEADSLGANIINVHQGNDIYPFINYPYSDVNVDVLKNFIGKVHEDHKEAKVYYTTRELTVNLPEFWPFVSLNGEVIYPGPGAEAKTLINAKGPDPWLKTNLRGKKYIPAWVAHFTEGKYAGMQDLSVITTPDSRLNNFYIAGLNWMVNHLKIDGIYIDDCSLDRFTIRRARKILDDGRPSARIDMHSWNHFNQYAGYASCLNLYMDLLPYIDQLWIGEGRNYDTPPDYWLVEIAGIPFGLPGQMLEGGGNPWRGMIYGITDRAGWSGTPPDNLWKFWDQYHIQQKEMIGYWDKNCPVTSSNDSVKVTVYKGKMQTIIAVANFGQTEQSASLKINYQQLGLDETKASFSIPFILRYQDEKQLASLENLVIPAKMGYLIVVENK